MVCVVSGTLEIQVFPGPPEYEDIKKGDAKEEGLYLRLDRPITIHFKDWDKNDAPAVESISLMQIAGEFDDARFYKLGEMKRKCHVTIKGEIFASFNAHHHTRFLIDPHNHISVDKNEFRQIITARLIHSRRTPTIASPSVVHANFFHRFHRQSLQLHWQ